MKRDKYITFFKTRNYLAIIYNHHLFIRERETDLRTEMVVGELGESK